MGSLAKHFRKFLMNHAKLRVFVRKVHVKLNNIQTMLMNYHKDIIELAKGLLIPIHNSIENSFNNDCSE